MLQRAKQTLGSFVWGTSCANCPTAVSYLFLIESRAIREIFRMWLFISAKSWALLPWRRCLHLLTPPFGSTTPKESRCLAMLRFAAICQPCWSVLLLPSLALAESAPAVDAPSATTLKFVLGDRPGRGAPGPAHHQHLGACDG